MLPVFLATFCQPWLYLAFGSCLQRTRLTTFMLTQPVSRRSAPGAPGRPALTAGRQLRRAAGAAACDATPRRWCRAVSAAPPADRPHAPPITSPRVQFLLAPVLFMARPHCSKQLAASPEAAAHLRHISGALNRVHTCLPLGLRIGGGSATAAAAAGGGVAPAAEVMRECEAVHMWLVALLAFCLPAIIIHRLEGQEQQASRRPRRGTPAAQAAGGSGDGRGGSGAGGLPWRRMLLQAPQSLLSSAGELALAGFLAWLAVQVAVPALPA